MIRFFTEKVAKRVLENDDEVSLVAPKKNAKKKEVCNCVYFIREFLF